MALLACLGGLASFCPGASSSLAIVNGGVEQAEDAPFVPADFRFFPGDYLYFTFQIGGFAVNTQNRGEVRKISLRYEVTPEDSAGVALAPPRTGALDSELNPEDKNWMPKLRESFLMPSFVAAGTFRIHVGVKDLVANTEASKDFPFQIGGVNVQPSNTIKVENFQFYRRENDREPLEVPAYSPGDTVRARFNMVGFQVGPQNEYHVSYGVKVLRPDGKVYIDQPHAAELQEKTFYPARYLPGVLDLTTSKDSTRGEYVIVLTVHDLVGNSGHELKTAFSIE